MATAKEMREQAAALIAKAEEQEQADKVKFFEDIKGRFEKSGHSHADYLAWAKPSKAAKGKSPLAAKTLTAKYRSPTGETWAGRGRNPAWLDAALKAGKKLEDFAIKS